VIVWTPTGRRSVTVQCDLTGTVHRRLKTSVSVRWQSFASIVDARTWSLKYGVRELPSSAGYGTDLCAPYEVGYQRFLLCSPLYTCPRDAAATGSGEISWKRDSKGAPSWASMARRAWRVGKGGIWSCSLASSAQISGGSTSGRVERVCPSLMKAGPRRMRASRSCAQGERTHSEHIPGHFKEDPKHRMVVLLLQDVCIDIIQTIAPLHSRIVNFHCKHG
jgi:hypothetical protein